MNQELNKCSFCKQQKPVNRQYLHAKNPQDSGDGFDFIYYCSDCGLKEIVLSSGDSSDLNEGQLELEHDIAALLNDVRSYEFHDFKNSAYSLPKVALGERLHALRLKAIEGKYDN